MIAIEGVDPNPRGQLDPGAVGRVEPCRKTTWCIHAANHDGECVEVERQPQPPPDYGPKRKLRWQEGR